jgi:hypothetical protein
MEQKELNTIIERTMDSIEGIQPASTDTSFTEKILTGVSQYKNVNSKGSAGSMWKLAAICIIIVFLNVFAIFSYESNAQQYTRESGLMSLAEEYLINTTSFNY